MDIVEFAEVVLGVELFEHQKQFIRECYSKGPNVYITIPPNMGRTDLRMLWLFANEVLYPNKKELTQNGQKTDNQ